MAPGKVRVRFAPSPTGYLHVGGARTALFNWLFARRHGGAFILRFEDTDVERSREELVAPMLETLRWLGLEWDEGPEVGGPVGPYFQSQRLDLYREAAARLEEAGRAYRCYCTPEELAAKREEAQRQGRSFRYPGTCRNLTPEERTAKEGEGLPYALRLVTPDSGEVVVKDLIHGDVTFPQDSFDDFIIMRRDGIPTYNFAVVVDDHLMGITHVIRADEHLSNTPRQILAYEALGHEPPAFAHVPMVLAPDRSKLSKRHGAVAVEEFRQAGYRPEAIINYLALLGWSPGDDREIMPVDEMVSLFSLERVSRTAAVYDVAKLAWMNGQYLRLLPLEEIVAAALPWFKEKGLDVEEDPRLPRIVDAVRQRVRTLAELADNSVYFFRDVEEYDPEGVRKRFDPPGTDELLLLAAEKLRDLTPFNEETIEKVYRDLCQEQGIGTGRLFHPTRLALTGRTVGPSLFEIMALLGREACVDRLERAAAFIKERAGGPGAS